MLSTSSKLFFIYNPSAKNTKAVTMSATQKMPSTPAKSPIFSGTSTLLWLLIFSWAGVTKDCSASLMRHCSICS